ncbi:hypothetical protein Rleg9DRAFT_1678 [Rhizobium leguminosarum bv. trifolii WSM597]|uniref:Uncharacterized protein n=1 Tax=Rhizobium leguminosarum bv. trifolii WSM597 TaxID=754764 RepID=I9N4Q6_RHILT|nr:hypothetical protein Rleg9DRAFT_1678 [Rhizobium leguminosarum bv. trifolii WSM597]
MRWRFPAVNDMTPQLDRCSRGHRPQALYGAISIISCPTCGEKITVETSPLFSDNARQREHEAWRAVLAWNERRSHLSAGGLRLKPAGP